MRRLYVLGYMFVVIATIAVLIGLRINTNDGGTMSNNTSSLLLSSPAFVDNTAIPAHYTCTGDNVSPPLAITGVPSRTESLTLILHDPDAPGGDFTHWLMWNIDPSTTQVEENSVPANVTQGTNGFKETGYGGPCPPSGTHHYVFELYALDEKLNLPTTTDQIDLIQTMQGHILDQTTLTGLVSK